MKLGNIISLVRGNTYKSALLSETEGPVLLGLGSIQRNGGFKYGTWKRYPGNSDSRILLYPGDLYVSLKDLTQSCDLLGAVARVPLDLFEGRLTQDTVKLEFNPGIDQKTKQYTYWSLRTPQYRAYCKARGTGTTNMSLSRKDFLGWDIPAQSEARDVLVNLFELFESKIVANAKLNGYLEELARAMYVGVMQEHANTAPLCDMAELNSETYSPKENWSAVCYIDTSALMLNNLAELQHFNPTEEKLPTRARRKVANGDILYSTVRPNQNHYGLLYNPMPHTLASTAFAVIRPSDITMSPLVYLALTDAGITEALQQLAETSTSTIPSIRPVDLEQIAVLVPSDEYGNEIAAQIEAAFKQIDCNKRENRELAILRDTLLPKLMSGEIDVSEIDPTQLNSHLA